MEYQKTKSMYPFREYKAVNWLFYTYAKLGVQIIEMPPVTNTGSFM